MRSARAPTTLPKFWRPKTPPATIRTARIVHWDLVDRFTKGAATRDDLWDWIETGFTYSQMMRMLAEDGAEFTDEAMQAIAAQLESYPAVIARSNRTGRIAFTGPELQTARAAAEVMDGLIGMDRHGIALRAAQWSQTQMDKLRGKA